MWRYIEALYWDGDVEAAARNARRAAAGLADAAYELLLGGELRLGVHRCSRGTVAVLRAPALVELGHALAKAEADTAVTGWVYNEERDYAVHVYAAKIDAATIITATLGQILTVMAGNLGPQTEHRWDIAVIVAAEPEVETEEA